NVDGDIVGPDTGPLPNVGGAPGVADGGATLTVCGSLRHAMAATAPSGAVIRNRLRVFMASPERIICRSHWTGLRGPVSEVPSQRPRLRDPVSETPSQRPRDSTLARGARIIVNHAPSNHAPQP